MIQLLLNFLPTSKFFIFPTLLLLSIPDMNESVTQSRPFPDDKVEVSIHLDPQLLDQIKHLTNDPSKVIEVAIRQWLRNESRRDADLTRTLPRNPPVPARGEWND